MDYYPAEVENALVAQKNDLLTRINAAATPDEFNSVVTLVGFVAPFYRAIGYGYKTGELALRIRDRHTNEYNGQYHAREAMTACPANRHERKRLKQLLAELDTAGDAIKRLLNEVH